MSALKSPLYSLNKRPFTLLEVLIAFSLVVLCVIPLIYPHSYIYKETKHFVNEIYLDRYVGALNADILHHLYQQQIPWEEIERSGPFPITDELLKRAQIQASFPWKGAYWFAVVREKNDKEDQDHVYRMNLVFAFLPKGSTKELSQEPPSRVYRFPFVLQRKTAEAATEEAKQEEQAPKEKQKSAKEKKEAQSSED